MSTNKISVYYGDKGTILTQKNTLDFAGVSSKDVSRLFHKLEKNKPLTETDLHILDRMNQAKKEQKKYINELANFCKRNQNKKACMDSGLEELLQENYCRCLKNYMYGTKDHYAICQNSVYGSRSLRPGRRGKCNKHRAYVHNYIFKKSKSLKSKKQTKSGEKVRNPLTNRMITKGGSVYLRLKKEGYL